MYDNTWTDITPTGFVNDASADPLGFGAYTYGSEDYGDARSQSGLPLKTGHFSFSNWGEDLVFVSQAMARFINGRQTQAVLLIP